MTVFEIAKQHKKLTVTMVSEVELLVKQSSDLDSVDMPWENARDLLAEPKTRELIKSL